MAQSRGGLCAVVTSNKKEEEEEVPVVACPGWAAGPCDYCDKRFGKWEELDDELPERIPNRPGLLMVALRSKAATEVVQMVLDRTDIQRQAFDSLDSAKSRVADKKAKVTKSAILCRWSVFKNPQDKDVVGVLAHWYNHGLLPKWMDKWVGMDVLGAADSVVFSEKSQKWCHPKKDAHWKKTKPPRSKLVEVIEGCDWTKACDICDANFGKWLNLEDVVVNGLAPEDTGLYMVGVSIGKETEVVDIRYDQQVIKLDIRTSLLNCHKSFAYVLKNKKFVHRNPTLKVRWMTLKDAESDNSCYLYAHWLNCQSLPMMTHKLPGEGVLERNKWFVVRASDKKWCYEVEALKQLRISKSKNKQHIMSDLEEDMRYLDTSENVHS